MDTWEIVKISLRNLQSNKIRSIITMLGVIIGVSSFIVMLALGEGARQKIVREIESLGTNIIYIQPDSQDDTDDDRHSKLKYRDYLKLSESLTSVEYLAPSITIHSLAFREDVSVESTIEGTTSAYGQIRNYFPATGRFLVERDVASWERVAVLGYTVAIKLFGTDNPIGKDIRIADQRFVIVGVMQYKPQTLYVKFNDKIFIPATTAFKFFTGVQNIDKILLQAKNNVPLDTAAAEIGDTLSGERNGRRDFILSTQEQYLATLTETSRTLKILLGTVAAISLIVGGIGIMNIMLVSVIERTKEIGLRIAVGATPADIIKQFIMESVTLSFIGGLVGVLVGLLSSNATGTLFTLILPGQEQWEAITTSTSIIGVLCFVVFVGVAAGIFPAYKAAKLDPSETLRYQ